MPEARRRPRLWAAAAPALGLVAGFVLGWVGRRRPATAAGEVGAGGYYATWPLGSRDASVAEHIEFQYAGIEHQTDAALSGMWLFLATELLFFGGLFFLYMIFRAQHPAGLADASAHTEGLIGTANTLLLLSSSAAFSYGLGQVRAGDNRQLLWASLATIGLGCMFLLLKGYEWHSDLEKHLFPGPGFVVSGSDPNGEQLFWCYYWLATVLHGIHMVVGIGLVAWVAWRARQNHYSPDYFTPVECVGLYWSFVDMVWLVLYPTIYLVGKLNP